MATTQQKLRIVARKLVKAYFKNNKGQPFIMTDGQCDIFIPIFFKQYRRWQIIAPTQYGKSEVIAMALILRSIIYREPWWIVTGQQSKSDIIMQKAISHLFDHPDLIGALEIDPGTPLDRLKRERSRDRLVWKDGGEIRAVTADARNRKRVTDALTGLGNPNIIGDESSLIPDDLQAMILRMLGGYEGGYLGKVGNPFTRGHFLRSWRNDAYHKVFIDYHQAMAEGRYTNEFIEEMRQEPFFEILYECQFPPEEAIDRDGYYRLLTDDELDKAYDPDFKDAGPEPGKGASPEDKKAYEERLKKYGHNRLGYDPGEGGDPNAGVIRNNKYLKTVHESRIKDTLAGVKITADLRKDFNVRDWDMFIDRIGIGSGLFSRLQEKGVDCVGVRWGESATTDTFANNKAEHYWKLRQWVKAGGKLCDKGVLDELRTIKYKEDSAGKIKIKSKEEMRKEGTPSPNRADAGAITFEKNAEELAPQVY